MSNSQIKNRPKEWFLLAAGKPKKSGVYVVQDSSDVVTGTIWLSYWNGRKWGPFMLTDTEVKAHRKYAKEFPVAAVHAGVRFQQNKEGTGRWGVLPQNEPVPENVDQAS